MEPTEKALTASQAQRLVPAIETAVREIFNPERMKQLSDKFKADVGDVEPTKENIALAVATIAQSLPDDVGKDFKRDIGCFPQLCPGTGDIKYTLAVEFKPGVLNPHKRKRKTKEEREAFLGFASDLAEAAINTHRRTRHLPSDEPLSANELNAIITTLFVAMDMTSPVHYVERFVKTVTIKQAHDYFTASSEQKDVITVSLVSAEDASAIESTDEEDLEPDE